MARRASNINQTTAGDGGSSFDPSDPLGDRIRSEVAEFSASLGGLFEAALGRSRRPSDLARLLNVDMPLASRLFRVALATDAAEAMDNLPTLNQARRAIESAAKLAPGPAADRARHALQRFETLAGELGDDQRAFESLVSTHLPTGVRRVELAQRRAAFRANTHLWGLESECFFNLGVFVPTSDPSVFDMILTLGNLGSRITRPGGEFRVKTSSDFAAPGGADGLEAARLPRIELLREFSSIDDSMIRAVEGHEKEAATEVVVNALLPSQAQSVVTRHYLAVAARRDQPDPLDLKFFATSPVARLHITLAVPVGISDPESVSLHSFANRHNPRAAYDCRDADRIPLHESPRVFHGIRALPTTAGVPRLPEMFTSALRRVGLEGRAFDVYRCDVEFPMLHSVTRLGTPFLKT